MPLTLTSTSKHLKVFEDQLPTEEKQKFYNSKAWRNVRRLYRGANPLCLRCENVFDRVKVAEVVDHIMGFKDLEQAVDFDNLASLCRSCHGYVTMLEKTIDGDIDEIIKLKYYKEENEFDF